MYIGSFFINSEIVNQEKGENEKEELFFIELDRDQAGVLYTYSNNESAADESSFGQNYLSSFTTIPGKSIASSNGNKYKNIPPATEEYFNSGGFETVTIEAYTDHSDAKEVIFVKNQADWMIYTGHGWSCPGKVKLMNDNMNPDWFGCENIQWDQDLNGVLLFACSVLDVNDYNNNYPNDNCKEKDNPNPGLKWINQIKGTDDLDILLGFNASGPLIVGNGGSNTLEMWRDNWLDGHHPLNSWYTATASDNKLNENACAINLDKNLYFYWEIEKNIWGRSKGWTWLMEPLPAYDKSGNVATSETQSHQVSLGQVEVVAMTRIANEVPNEMYQADFEVYFENGDIDLVLRSPSGIVINHESVDMSDAVYQNKLIHYAHNERSKIYTIRYPEAGEWSVEIANAQAMGEEVDYELIVNYDTVDPNALYEPGNLTAERVSSTEINLSWDRGINISDNGLQYIILRSLSYDMENIEFNTTVSDTSFLNTGLNPNTVYYFRVGSYKDGIDPVFGDVILMGTCPSEGPGKVLNVQAITISE